MKKRSLRLNLKKIEVIILIGSILIGSFEKSGLQIQAKEMVAEVVNHGIYDREKEQLVIQPGEETQIPWISAGYGEVFWKVSIEKEPWEIQSVEIYREGEAQPFQVLERVNELEIPIQEQEYEGVYKMVVKDLEGNTEEAKQYLKIDRIPPVFTKTKMEAPAHDEKNNPWYDGTLISFQASVDVSGAEVSEVYVSTTEEYSEHTEHKLALEKTDDLYHAELKDDNFDLRTYYFYAVDEAGNATKGEKSYSLKRDSQAPVLTKVTYIPEGNVVKIGEKNYRFYQTAGKARLDLLEANFPTILQQNEFLPVYSGNGLLGDWNFEKEKNTAVANMEFPLKKQEEIEYQYSVFYKDFAGNLMVGKEELVCVDGRYQSDMIVVDHVSPILKEFSVKAGGEEKLDSKNGLDYAKNMEGDDAKITVVIDDHTAYFHPESLELEYSADGKSWKKIETEQKWNTSGREHTLVCGFDGEEKKEMTYQFRISYKDRAGNAMILGGKDAPAVEKCADGVYKSSQKVVIDHCAPTLSCVQFSEPIQMYHGETEKSNGVLVGKIISEETRLYYDSDAEVSFVVREGHLHDERIKLEVYYRKDKSDEWNIWEEKLFVSQLSKEISNEYRFTMPSEEGEYYFKLFCMDASQNRMIYGPDIVSGGIGEDYREGINDGTYQSPVFVKDSTRPKVEICHEQEQKNQIVIKEKNLDLESTIVFVTAKDINGNIIQNACPRGFSYDSEKQGFCANWGELAEWITSDKNSEQQILLLEPSAEAHYTIKVIVTDKVKKTVEEQIGFCIDRSAPYITVVTKDGKSFTNEVNVSCGILDDEKSDVKYSVVNNGWFARIINKLTFGYFAQAKMIVRVGVHDEISGVAVLAVTCLQDGQEIFDYIISEPKISKEDLSVVQYEIELPVDFKGNVRMHGSDCAGNVAKDTGAIGMIIETKKQHDKYAKTNVEVLTPYSKTPEYYSGDVTVKFEAGDGYSGLYEVNYLAGIYQETIAYPAGEEICQETSKNYTINAASNNCNHVKLGLDFQDNAGHMEYFPEEKLPVIHIDKTKPKIQVVYDHSEVENEKYYKTERKAEVIITERNFDPKDTKLVVSGPSVKKSGWKHIADPGCAGSNNPFDTKHTDQCRWSSSIYFSEDGEYTFTCSTTDLAGNEAAYGQTDVFVIDKIIPKMKVTYDNHEVSNGCYYHAPRTATIEITERNFDASNVEIQLTARNDEKEILKPTIGPWVEEGDIHRTIIVYDYEGEFTFDIRYTDLAGNRAAESVSDKFVIDLTVPKIEITGVKNQSANNGIVAPIICCTDTNFDAGKMRVEITGYRNGIVQWKGTKEISEKGVELKLKDAEYTPERDDFYTLYVSAYDLAGNCSETTWMFSVNRFGSVYTFDEATERLVGEKGAYYTAKEQDLVVYETNVDTLKFRKITLNLNGKLQTLMEGEHFEVTWEEKGQGWKQYTYHIRKENFTEEGIYILTIYSEDRAENKSDNQNKGKKIEFIVDKTSPSVVITGIENKKQYREPHKEITIDVEDNVCVEYMEVIVNGKIVTYDALELAKTDGKIKFLLESENDWQTLVVRGYDAAGNITATEEIKFLITANLFVQFYRNRLLFCGSMGAMFVFGGCAWLIEKKRKKNTVSS